MDSVFKGVSKLCRNAETFSPLELPSLMEPGIKSMHAWNSSIPMVV